MQQIKPAQPIAEFGAPGNPLFTVEGGYIPGTESTDTEPFVIRDFDQGLPERRIAAGELDNIDLDAGSADLDFELDNGSNEAIYTLLPSDIVVAIGAAAKVAGIKKVNLRDTNLPAKTREQIDGPAQLRSADNSKPFEFRIAA